MNGKKAIQWVAIAFVVFYLLSQPANAANAVNGAAHKLSDAGTSLGKFLNGLGK